MSGSQKPLELILARNLLTSVTTPAFLVARDGALLFYNEGAGALPWAAHRLAATVTATSELRMVSPGDI